MGNEVAFIVDQLRRSLAGGAWHGPSLLELLADVDQETSDRRPPHGGHTIREIVLHVRSWQAAALRAVEGSEMPSIDQPWDGDWPQSGQLWRETKADLERTSQALADAVAAIPEAMLEQPVPGRDAYNFRFLLHGIVQHNLYHAGQIALLKK